jgi:hypothetical protein
LTRRHRILYLAPVTILCPLFGLVQGRRNLGPWPGCIVGDEFAGHWPPSPNSLGFTGEKGSRVYERLRERRR